MKSLFLLLDNREKNRTYNSLENDERLLCFICAAKIEKYGMSFAILNNKVTSAAIAANSIFVHTFRSI